MKIGFSYNTAIQQLQQYVQKRTLEQYNNKPEFKTASQMPYANNIQIADKAERLILQLISHYLKNIEPEPKSFFKSGEIIPIPDIHGDFVHLITMLHKHVLLDNELNFNKDFTYLFLGDFYNRGKDANLVDYWLNKQISKGTKIYRIAGNHELFFLARNADGKTKITLRDPRDGKQIPIHAFDVENDMNNGYQITEELLNSIKTGNLLTACTFLDAENNIPKLYSHTFVTSEDLGKLSVDKLDIVSFVQSANERFKMAGTESYQRFMDSKTTGKFDWEEISEPIFKEPLFNIFYRDKNHRVDALFMRVTGLNNRLKIITEINDNIPEGIYQTVGHTKVTDFDLPDGVPINRPLILADKDSKAFVQFSDIAMGTYYSEDDINRPEVFLNP